MPALSPMSALPFNDLMQSGSGIGALLIALCACATPVSQGDPLAMLDEAGALMAVGDPAGARALLESVNVAVYPELQRARYKLLLARATQGTGQPWGAFQIIRGFSEEFPHSDLRLAVEQLIFECGRQLSESDKSFFIFSSDRADARVVLEHLILRYPRTTWLADALQILGEMAFEDEEYTLALTRFKDLLQQQPDSEWAPLARFRIAMSEFRVLHGPAYDMEQMERAHNELLSFLAHPPERPDFVDEARAAVTVVVDWMTERHLMIADFYKTIGNPYGERFHLRLAAEQFPDTDAGRTAAERLSQMATGGDGR